MSNEKIIISLEDVNSEQVDAEVKRQEISSRMSAHQAYVESTTRNTSRMNPQGLFRRSIVYMAVFGLLASLLAWGLGEIAVYKEESNPLRQYLAFSAAYWRLSYNSSWSDFEDTCREVRSGDSELSREYRDNPYFQDRYLNATSSEQERIRDRDELTIKIWYKIWFILVAVVISVGMSVAEPIVGRNSRATMINGALAAGLGVVGGLLVSIFVDDIYHFLGGGSGEGGAVQQMFARGVGWSILGAFVAIAPGIAMRSWKKFGLGLAGGAVGGLLGGVLFDLICRWTGSDVPARCCNILGLGVGASLATAFLENLAKQGWLRVATGVITGKQFILYRNPTIIGSSPKSEIYLFKDPSVAARHAAINGVGGNFIVTALGGATVLLNGYPVRQQTLRNGDRLKIGSTLMLFEARAMRKG